MMINNLLANKDHLVHHLYNPYLQESMIQEELSFWKSKMISNPTQVYYQKYAACLTKLYGVNADLEYLFEAEDILDMALGLHPPQSSSIYRSMVQIKIKQHRFCEALEDLLLAEKLGDNLNLTNAMFFDVYFELGKDDQVQYYLDILSHENDFDYLIRLARWHDSEGRLSDAILKLEEAKLMISDSDIGKMNWIYSNLADFYGHDGQIDKAFEYYKIALQMNSSDWYSLKGLAWVMYSDNRDVVYAIEILNEISSRYFIPVVENLRYEILSNFGESEKASMVKEKLIAKLDHESYFSSYSGLLFDLLIEDPSNFAILNNILAIEKFNRESPEYYAKYVQLLLISGNEVQARHIAHSEVLDKTFEPDALRRILPAMDDNANVYNFLLEQLKEAKFELGPQKYKIIYGDLI